MRTPETKLYRFKMSITHNGKWKAIAYKDVVCLKAAGNFTQIYLHHTKIVYNTSFPLKYLEKELPGAFFRIHRSTILNIAYTGTIDHTSVITTTNETLPLAARNVNALKQRLGKLPELTIPVCRHCLRCDEWEACPDIRPFIKWDGQVDGE